MWNNLSAFYNSPEWNGFRNGVIADRLNKNGETVCELCGKPIIKAYDCIAHHVKPLTLQNVNDFAISLNPANIQLLHAKCHNEVHARFGYYTERKVYFVYGAPCSGKTTYVNDVKGNSDLVVDMDNIWQCITGGERYEKPNALKTIAFGLRDSLLDMVKTRAGKWERAFVISGGAVKGDRERQISILCAEPIFISEDKKTCLQRLYGDERRTSEQKREWGRYIDRWFDDFTE